MEHFDQIDTRLLDEFQRDLPLVSRPFAVMAQALGLEEACVLDRLTRLKGQGALTRVGATIRPNTVGQSTLAALAVPEERLEEVAAIVGAEPGVNHSYLREAEWNLWFVATAPDADMLRASLARIEARTGLTVLDLRLVKPFNIDLGFRLTAQARPMAAPRAADPSALRPEDRPLLHALSQGLDIVARPFATLADRLGWTEAQVLARIDALLKAGLVSRLGVIVRHRTLGWTSNAMVVWDVPESEIAAVGPKLAALPGVTLCYQRRSVPDVWPYQLYCMIHGKSRDQALAVLATARALPALSHVPHRVLFSTRCFKQSGAQIAEVV
ncbi:Lrp/AsnC family transcriptional regulator [Pseudorhodobacter turbinis]|uniref:siroheme decarboxylase n=1 Tax=Pseudorhodobacter turbinis TaxID=2500533 RepID=A0A4P8EI68_9RHOB|nr:AsnC family transcriptional regulator [Pseudorhodobacter turbinis]QCO56315.1 Lrp/AsnC family transcriptional regulator [Pseudorhodobacter turbinis]